MQATQPFPSHKFRKHDGERRRKGLALEEGDMRVAPDYVVDGEDARQVKKPNVELLKALRYARLGHAAAAAKSIKSTRRLHV